MMYKNSNKKISYSCEMSNSLYNALRPFLINWGIHFECSGTYGAFRYLSLECTDVELIKINKKIDEICEGEYVYE